jgi:hypothetical protein
MWYRRQRGPRWKKSNKKDPKMEKQRAPGINSAGKRDTEMKPRWWFGGFFFLFSMKLR